MSVKKFFILNVIIIGIILISSIEVVNAGTHDIWNCNDLQSMNGDLSGTWNLRQNIDCGGSTRNFQSIGSMYSDFSGHFNGNCFKISNLYQNSPTAQGLFAYVRNGATITNVGLVDVSITNTNSRDDQRLYCYIGALAGFVIHSTISGCYATGSISVPHTIHSSVEGDLAGGLIGEAGDSQISNSYSEVNIASGCCNWVGGFIGGTGTTTFTNCYSRGFVPMSNQQHSGGFVAWSIPGIGLSTYNHCFYDTTTSSATSDGGGNPGLPTSAMQTAATFTSSGWTSGPWNLNNGAYPTLSCFCTPNCAWKNCGLDGCGGFCGSFGGGCLASNPICRVGVCGCDFPYQCGTDSEFGDSFCKADGNIYRKKIIHSCSNTHSCSNSVIDVKIQTGNGHQTCSSCTNNCACVGKKVSIGLYNPTTSTFFLRNSNTGGAADINSIYGPANSGYLPIAGDWNGDGTDSFGLYAPVSGTFLLRDDNICTSSCYAGIITRYGAQNAGLIPIAGDWNGDGIDSIGLYQPSTGTFMLRDSNTCAVGDPCVANYQFPYGPANAGLIPLAGDWNGDGKDTIGLYDPKTSTFMLRNTNSGGYADITFNYGPINSGWKPFTGDFDGDGKTTVGLYNPSGQTIFIRDSNTGGVADYQFAYGPANNNWLPISGDWDGNGKSNCTMAIFVNPCTSTCPTNGEKQCLGNKLQTCADHNSDTCFEWGGDIDCPTGCNSLTNQCNGCTPDCTNKDCGGNGCTGFCGTDPLGLCPLGQECDSSQKCVSLCKDSGNLWGIEDTKLRNGKCLGVDNLNSTPDDCCPAGAKCVSDDPLAAPPPTTFYCKVDPYCSLHLIESCQDYPNQADCQAQPCGVGVGCDDTTLVHNICGAKTNGSVVSGSCRCIWDDNPGLGHGCKLNTTTQINIDTISINGSCFTDQMSVGECNDEGVRSVKKHSSIAWQNLDAAINVVPGVTDDNTAKLWAEKNCTMDQICFTGTQNIVCEDTGIRLGFFNWINFGITLVIICLIYFILFFQRKI